MDPVSLSASIVGLTNAGLSIGNLLLQTYSSYTKAPRYVAEIAQEIEICCFTMTPMGERLKAGSLTYNPQFQKIVKTLINNSEETFEDMRKLVPNNGELPKGMRPRWKTVWNSNRIEEHRTRLKQIQHMFRTVKEFLNDEQLAKSQGGSRIDASQNSPITLSGPGTDASGAPVVYEATFIVRPMNPTHPQDEIENRQRVEHEVLKSKSEAKSNFDMLKRLRQSPYFSAELLETSMKSRPGRPPCSYLSDEVLRSSTRPRLDRVETSELAYTRKRKDSDSDSDDDFQFISDQDAAVDVLALKESWFGDAKEDNRRPSTSNGNKTPTDRPKRPSVSIDTQTLPLKVRTPKSPAMPPSPAYTPSPRPKSPHSPSSSYFGTSRRNSTRFDCDSCGKPISKSRYECRSCSNYDLCKKCFDDPNITIRLRHQHPKSHFVEIR